MKAVLTILLIALSTFSFGQTIADFENILLEQDTFVNGSEGSGAYISGKVVLPNFYNLMFSSWTGWAISTKTDVTTPGFFNQYSAITGSGFDESDHYAVTYVFRTSRIELPTEEKIVEGFYITNGTYPYLSMRDGDGFAKKFGGITGDDPDYFLLTIKKYLNGAVSSDSIDFYLADYRFSDNSMDYIVDEWTWVDCSSLGEADSLVFTMSSTDNGQFGMNTPSYFCVDNITTSESTTNTEDILLQNSLQIYPNPASDFLIVQNDTGDVVNFSVYDLSGKKLSSGQSADQVIRLDIKNYPLGTYLLRMETGQSSFSELFIKQ